MARITSPTVLASEARPALAGRLEWAEGTYMRSLLAITGLGLLIRGLFLGLAPLWTDEAFMGVLVRRSVGAMINVVHNDNHPPLQYMLDRVATLFHDSPEGLRVSSVIAGVAAIPLAAALGRRLGGDRAGIAAGLLTATMPPLVTWSRDARMYALATTLVLAMALVLWRAVERPTAGRVATYFVVTVLAVWTHYLVALAVPAQLAAALLVLRPSRPTLYRVMAAALAAGLTLVPWLIYAAPQFRHAGDVYWITPLSMAAIRSVLVPLISHPGTTTLIAAVAVVAIPAVALLSVATYRAAELGRRRGLLYLGGCGGFALAILFAVSLKKPLWDERFINLYSTELLPVAGAALASTGRRGLVAGVAAALAAVSVFGLATLPTADIPALVRPLAGRVQPGRDMLVLNGPYHYFQVLYYGDGGVQATTRVVSDQVPWYFGLAGFRAGDIVRTVPDAPGTVYLVTDPGQRRPTMPINLHLAGRRCAHLSCVETWSH